MKLNELRKNTPLVIDGYKGAYHHTDWPYSVCTVEMDGKEWVMYLLADTPVKRADGYYEVVKQPVAHE